MNISRHLAQPNNIARSTWLRTHLYLVIFLVLAGANLILYFPVLNAYFISDDFQFLSYLYFNVGQILNGQKWEEWFSGGIAGYVFFRPVGNMFWLSDYIAYDLAPFGYHAATVLLHILASFEVFIFSHLITSNRTTSAIAATLFAVMPVHAEAVAWIAARYDSLSGLYYFAGLIFFVLYLQRRKVRLYLISVGAFLLALSSKETALTFPIILLLYDALLNFRGSFRVLELLRKHVPFWGIALIRLVGWGHGYRGLQFMPEGLWYWIDGNILRVVDPLVFDVTSEARWVFVLCTTLLFFLYRDRRPVLFGLIWIPVTLIPTTVGGIADRSFYIPSLGLSLVLASILTPLVMQRSKILKGLGLGALLLLALGYSMALFSQNQAYYRAGEVAKAIPQQVKALHPTLPPDARLVFVGVPDQVPEGPLIYATGLRNSIALTYQSPIQVYKYTKFPLWFDRLDGTYFFQLDHRRVTERADLVRALEERRRCAGLSRLAIAWDFSDNAHGWEPWNQISRFEIGDGVLTIQSEGNEPYMGSPKTDIPTMAIGDIEISMRVRGSQPTMNGALYWLASGQQEFSPDLQESFQVQADGEFHTYRVDIAERGMLLIGDRILRLRFDPVDAPAEITIKSIQVSTHCREIDGARCICPP